MFCFTLQGQLSQENKKCFMVELRKIQTFLWNIKPPIKFLHFMLHLGHSRAVELPPSTNANYKITKIVRAH